MWLLPHAECHSEKPMSLQYKKYMLLITKVQDILGLYQCFLYSVVIKNYQQVLAFLYAVKEVNENPGLLANITMGFHIYDSYFNDRLTFQTTMNLLYRLKTTVPNYKCDSGKNLVAITGALHSETSLHMATISSIYKIPQVGKFIYVQ